MADEGKRCRWGDGWGSSGVGNEVIAGQMGVAGSGMEGENFEGIWCTGEERRWESGSVAEERDREPDNKFSVTLNRNMVFGVTELEYKQIVFSISFN